MNTAISSYCILIYQGLLYFWGTNGLLRDCFQTAKVYVLSVERGECNSLVKHSGADRDVGGSIPLAPFFIIIGYLSKDFRRLKD